jgi:rod shape-determining protein MreC
MLWLRGHKILGVLLLSALVAPFLFFSSPRHPWAKEGSLILNLAQDALYPFEYGWQHSLHFVKKKWSRYFLLLGVEQENETLKKDLTLLQAKILDYNHQLAEVNRLRALLNFSSSFGKKILIAEVVGNMGTPPFQTIRIAQGHKQGVRVGMPVISAKGIVGRVLRTSSRYADVQRLGDAHFNLDVLIERNRIRGILKGLDDSTCLLQLHRRADVRIGDSIVTSGMSGPFPKGLPVGNVVRISYEMDNISQVVTIRPWVEPQGLDELMILQNTSDATDTITELGGDEWMNDTHP